jgi:nickel-dependent lactate racemase
MTPISIVATAGRGSADLQIAEAVAKACPAHDYRGKRVLVIVPDGTRTAPIGPLFKSLHGQLAVVAQSLDVLIALGTHPPMSEAAICRRLGIREDERQPAYGKVRFFNHAWNDPGALKRVGVMPADETHQLSGGLLSLEVPVEVNRLLFDYDQVILIGPVFPHEVVGFSGGNKYLFPGVSGPALLNFFHWLGAVVTSPKIIGHKWTPVRRVVDRAAAMVHVPKLCFCLVVQEGQLAGLFAGSPESAWDTAADLSSQLHITVKDRPFRTVLSCAPAMYDELWTGGKCMYKLEPVLADGGELIIYAPHISEISATHGKLIAEVGYHCRDYFVKQWDKFRNYPWAVLAHSTHVRGLGAFENGLEKCRGQVTLATAIPENVCRRLNLGYRDPRTIRPADFANREPEGVLLVPKAGETLFRLRHPPEWAGGED